MPQVRVLVSDAKLGSLNSALGSFFVRRPDNHVTGFGYDSMGNVTNDGGNTYVYDAEGRQLTAAGGTTTFDAFNRAVKIVKSSGTTQIMYAPNGWKFALMNGNTVQKYMVPLAGGLQAVYTANTPAQVAYYRHADWLGSSRLETNADRTVLRKRLRV